MESNNFLGHITMAKLTFQKEWILLGQKKMEGKTLIEAISII